LLYTVTDQDTAFLVPDSCISADITGDHHQNTLVSALFSWKLFWVF